MLCSDDSRILEDGVPTASARKMCSLESSLDVLGIVEG